MENLSLKLYPLIAKENRCFIEPAIRSREWMTKNPHSYKCFPITNANSFGWDILTSCDIEIEWNGENKSSDLVVHTGTHQAKTNFGFGIVTFHIGYTWHTSDNWSMMFCPIPNYDHQYFTPLSALVETDKLKYPIFVSAKMNQQGRVFIPKRTPICRVFPMMTLPVIDCEPDVLPEPIDFQEYRNWQAKERTSFLSDKEKQKEQKGWQKFYYDIAENPSIKMKEIKQPKIEFIMLPNSHIESNDNE